MASYVAPIQTALVVFPILLFLVFVPVLIYQYRKNGAFLTMKAVILYSFLFYLVCAYFMTILPLPDREAVAQYTRMKIQLQPFLFVKEFMRDSYFKINDPQTYMASLKQSVFLQPAFNVLLLLPFGVYLRYYFRWSLKRTIFASFLFSLFFELTQLSGLYGIYPRPYRLFDVDDLFLNTLGGTMGYLMAPFFTFFLPTIEQLLEKEQKKGTSIPFFRRLTALGVDLLVLSFLMGVTAFFAKIFRLGNVFERKILWTISLNYVLWVILYFVCFSYFYKGKTLGKALVKVKVIAESSQLHFKALLVRYGLLYLLFWPLMLTPFTFLSPFVNSLEKSGAKQAQWLIIVYAGISFVLFLGFLCIVYRALRQKPLFYERWSKTKLVSQFEYGSNQENEKIKSLEN